MAGRLRLFNTTVVMFGLGDQGGYPETFLDAMGSYRRFRAGEWRYRVLPPMTTILRVLALEDGQLAD